eukprot:symbB.v1.2.001524.t1/scaffold83.1/size345278/8
MRLLWMWRAPPIEPISTLLDWRHPLADFFIFSIMSVTALAKGKVVLNTAEQCQDDAHSKSLRGRINPSHAVWFQLA